MALNQKLVIAAFIFYILASIGYFAGSRIAQSKRVVFFISTIGTIFNLLTLIHMTIINGRLPLATGYEFLLSFTWVTAVLYLLYQIKGETKGTGGPVMLIIALLSLVTVLQMSGNDGAGPLMPALKSPWLTVHVLTAVLAYGGFTLAAGMASFQLSGKGSPDGEQSIYKIIAVAFAMLSLSIVLGAIWAEQAWGTYWSWDPKETWALITWIIYAIYLHLHRQRGWRGRNANILVIAGFILVLFTFFGVNYLMSGLHSYA